MALKTVKNEPMHIHGHHGYLCVCIASVVHNMGQ